MVSESIMLPLFVREMHPMKELLSAEDTVFLVIDRIINEMIEDSKIVIINRMNLETVRKLVNDFTQCVSSIEEKPEELTLRVVVRRDFKLSFNFKRLTSNLNLLIPAHLKIVFENRIVMEANHYIGIAGGCIRTINESVTLGEMFLPELKCYCGIGGSKNKKIEGEVRL